jgi:hypothetical protein
MDVKAGVIDADFTGNIMVVLENSGKNPFTIQTGDRITQMVYTHIATPELEETQNITPTDRGNNGFGSTTDPTIHHMVSDANKATQQVVLLTDPFDDTLEIMIMIKGDNPTLGFQLTPCPHCNRLQLRDMAMSTLGSRIQRWKSLISNAYLLTFDTQQICTT